MSEVRERRFQAGGIATVLAESGPAGAEEAIVYVHGNPGAALDWHDLMARTGDFARSLALDMPGFGRADKPRDLAVPVEGFAGFLDAALGELGVRRAHLVLHDFGGPWGLAWAAAHREAWASVVLMNTGVLVGFEVHRAGRLWATPVVGELVMLATTRRAWRKAFADTGVPAGMVERMYDHYDRDTRRLVLKLYRNRTDDELLRRVAAMFEPLDVPALVVWGAKDPFVPVHHAEQQREIAFPGARVEVLPESGHWPFADDPDGVAAVVVPFLRERVGASPAG
ncbi:MAG TPA: alpha/beta hydrolase [Solirubrobacteraceae bacterium]|nr:alpha/beta hydrolase [Solirubrobacteraceae bacterium]